VNLTENDGEFSFECSNFVAEQVVDLQAHTAGFRQLIHNHLSLFGFDGEWRNRLILSRGGIPSEHTDEPITLEEPFQRGVTRVEHRSNEAVDGGLELPAAICPNTGIRCAQGLIAKTNIEARHGLPHGLIQLAVDRCVG